MTEIRMAELHDVDGFEELYIESMLAWVAKSDRRPRLRIFNTPFHGQRVPQIRLREYVTRIMQYGNCSPVCYTVAFALMRRLADRYDDMIPNIFNVHRILLVSVLLAVKANEDVHFDNKHYSKVGGIVLSELNELEIAMLERFKFDLKVSVTELLEAETSMVKEITASCLPTSPKVRLVLNSAGYSCEEEVQSKKRPASPSLERSNSPKSIIKRDTIGDGLQVSVR